MNQEEFDEKINNAPFYCCNCGKLYQDHNLHSIKHTMDFEKIFLEDFNKVCLDFGKGNRKNLFVEDRILKILRHFTELLKKSEISVGAYLKVSDMVSNYNINMYHCKDCKYPFKNL